MDGLKVATVGNPAIRVPDAKGFPLPTWMGAIPGMSALATDPARKRSKTGLLRCLPYGHHVP
jgi:hypothetical protein